MIDDILFYAAVYLTLFVSVFWLVVFLGGRDRPQNRASRLPSLSIIIPAYNEESHLEKCVRSLAGQDYRGLRILIVDDGSTDNTAAAGRLLARRYPLVRYVRKKHQGKAAALNAGLSLVRTECFGFIDADTFLSEGALKNMVGRLSGRSAAVIAVVKPARPGNFVERLQKIEYMLASFTRKLMSLLDSLYYTPGFALYRTDVIKSLGGFDEHNLTEDLEIGLRLKDSGYRIENTADDYAYTVVPKTMRDLFNQRMRWYRGYIHNSRKYSGMFFSRRHGDLGMFILPMQYILLAVTAPLFLLGAYNVLVSAARNIIDARLVGYDIAYFLETGSFNPVNHFTFFVLAMLGAFLLILGVSGKRVRERISPAEYAIYILVYPFVNLFLWAAAFSQEMLGKKKSW